MRRPAEPAGLIIIMRAFTYNGKEGEIRRIAYDWVVVSHEYHIPYYLS